MIAKAPRQNVFVDLSPLAPDGSNGGAAPSVLELLRLLVLHPEPHSYHLIVKPEAATLLEPHQEAGAAVHVLGREPSLAEPRRLLRERRRLPRALRARLDALLPDTRSLRRAGATALFSPLQTAAFHEEGLWHVATAHDFQELSHPAFFPEKELRRRRAFRADLRRANRVAAISAFTRRVGVEEVGLRPDRVVVLAPAVGERPPLPPVQLAERLAALGLTPGGFAFYPANFWPHKNHERLLHALASSPLREDPSFRLVLCGALDDRRARLASEAAALGLLSRVTFLPYQTEVDVTALLQGARFLVFPSLYEGFGIPVLEAFRLGTPVAASRIPALEELAGDSALFFDVQDEAAMRDACQKLWTDEAERGALAARARARAGRYVSAETVAGYHGLLEGRSDRGG